MRTDHSREKLSNEQRSNLQQLEAQLNKNESWSAALERNSHKLSEEKQIQLRQKLTQQRAYLLRKIDELYDNVGGEPSVLDEQERRKTEPQLHAKGRRRSPRAVWIVAGVLIAVVVVVGFFALRQVDAYAQTVVDQEIRSFIEESGLTNVISYSRLEVDSLRGLIRFYDVSFVSPNPRSRARADELVVRMPHQDLIAVASDPETATISGVRVSLVRGEFADTYRVMQFGLDEVSAGVRGHFPLAEIDDPVNFRVDTIEFSTEGLSFRDEESGLSGRIEATSYTLNGELVLMELEQNPYLVLEQLHSVRMQLVGSSLSLDGEAAGQLTELQLMLGEYAWVAELENWIIEESDLELYVSPQELTIERLSFVSPMLRLDGRIRIGLDGQFEPDAFEGELEFLELHPGIRTVAAPYVSAMGFILPAEGRFTARFSYDPIAGPWVEID